LPIDLRPYQLEGVDYALKSRRCFIALPMRTGKSPVALEVLRRMKAYPAVIVCPSYTRSMWQRLLNQWSPESRFQFNNEMPKSGMDVYVVSYDALVAKDKKGTPKKEKTTLSKMAEALRNLKPKAVILDESQYIRSGSAKRTKAVKAIAKSAFLRLCLTGTVIESKPLELVPQLEFLDRSAEFSGGWMFRKKYCVSVHHSGTWSCTHPSCLGQNKRKYCHPCPGWMSCECGKSKWGYWDFSGAANLQDLHRRLADSCFFRKRREEIELELPEFTREIVPIILDDDSDYKKAEDDFVAWMVTNRGLEAAQRAYRAEAIVKMNVLKELAAAAKIDAAVEWINDYLSSGDSKLIAFTSHHSVMGAVLGRTHGTVAAVHGKIEIGKREEAIEIFRSRADCRLLVANIAAAGLGLDLSMADGCVFLEMEWTPSIHDQAEARLVHHERRKPVTASYFIARGTIEEQIYDTLQRKRQIVSEVIDGRKITHVHEEGIDIEMDVANELVKERLLWQS
jgi:SWI/SNF-related matrix-associated actin-dependent regulator of chromatin subfamily A-like protein 1